MGRAVPLMAVAAAAWLLCGCAGRPTLTCVQFCEPDEDAVFVFRPEQRLESIIGLSADGRLLACQTRDAGVCLYSTQTGELVAQAPGRGVWRPDGKLVASALHEISILTLEDGKQVFQWNGEAEIGSLALSADGRLLAIGGSGYVCLLDVVTGSATRNLWGLGGWIRGLAFSQDGKMLASAGTDGNICLWDMAADKKLGTLEAGQGEVSTMCFSADGKTLLARGERYVPPPPGYRGPGHTERRSTLYDVATGRELLSLPCYVSVSGDRSALVRLSGSEQKAYVYDMATGAKIGTAPTRGAVVFATGSDVMVAQGPPEAGAQVFALWRLSDCRRLAVCSVTADDWECAAVSADTGILGLRRRCGLRMCLVDRATGRKLVDLASTPYRGGPSGLGDQIVFSPDGTKAATLFKGGVVVMDVAAGLPEAPVEGPRPAEK